ncbi:MAG: transcription elongation factor GreA [Flavobacteriales bacterium]
MGANTVYLTTAGMAKLKGELDQLKHVERLRISRQIAEARDKGDLSENAEYDAAKEAQGFLELKIFKLEAELSNAKIIKESDLDNSKVLILSKVKLKNWADKTTMHYTLVPENEVDIKAGKISINTSIAKGLLGKKRGDIAEIALPNGNILKLEVLEISR